jgi:DNA repair exonuclease SbcCD ATPase subunit
MPDSEQATPVGQIPVTGGRERRYANDAERARAWRERQKARRTDAFEGGSTAVTPELAEASLAVLLDRLAEVGRAHEATVGELAGRVEDAIGALADPEAVAEALAGARAEAARQVAEAEERAIRASQAKAAAEAAARDATQARIDAEEAANGAWERTETLEAEFTALRQELEAVCEGAAQEVRRHSEELEALRAVHAEQLNETQRQAQDTVTKAREAAGVAIAEANAGRDRAEGTATELRAELEAAARAAEAALASARSEAAEARTELAEQLASRYQAETETAQAKADAEITRAQVRAEGAQELAENRANEISRLIAQVEDLRADLRRARDRNPE